MSILVDSNAAVEMSLILGVKAGRLTFAVDEIRFSAEHRHQQQQSKSQGHGQRLNARQRQQAPLQESRTADGYHDGDGEVDGKYGSIPGTNEDQAKAERRAAPDRSMPPPEIRTLHHRVIVFRLIVSQIVWTES